MTCRWLLWSALAGLLGSAAAAPSLHADDWPHWRGPFQNGQSAETGFPTDWDPEGGEDSNVLWKRDDLGTLSSPVVFEDRLYAIVRHNKETPQEQEKVVCVDAKTGETLWESIFNIFLTDVPDSRVAWSSPVVDTETGNVYALGVEGIFRALNGKSGELLWEHSMSEEFGLLTTYGGRTNFPIVFEDLVIISGVVIGWGEQAKPTHRFYAMDKTTGQVVWNQGTRPLPDDTTYSAPTLAAFNGEKALVFGAGDGGIYALQPRTGKQIWHYDISSRGINTTPLVVFDNVYAGHMEENVGRTEMGAFFSLNGTQVNDGVPQERYTKLELFAGKSAPLVVGDKAYIADSRAKLHVLNAETGEELGEQRMGTIQLSSPVWIDGHIWSVESNGRWFVMKPEGDGLEVVSKGRLPRGENNQGSIAVSNGRIFIPTTGALYCVSDPDAESLNEPGGPQANEEAPVTDKEVAQIQLVPAEGLLFPRSRQPLALHTFNAAGQFLGDVPIGEAELKVSGPGEVKDGAYLPGGDAAAVGIVTATHNGQTAEARYRVVPELDWDITFDDGLVPETWVGARYRCVVLDRTLLDELRESDPMAADLYIVLQSSLTNSGAPKLTVDNSTPDQKYADLLRFFGLNSGEDSPQTKELAEATFGPPMEKLKEAGVLGSYEFSTWDSVNSEGKKTPKPRITFTPGKRDVKDGVMVKIRTIPKGTRSQSWMGHPQFENYTITADIMGYQRDGKLPDMGLIAQRYTLDLQGAAQSLQIRTWTPQLYAAKTVPFEWKADTWYTMKFHAGVEDGKAVLKGKVWEKGTDEPDAWTVETTHDGVPNLNGSPGFFGNAKDSEILYDNIRVTKN